MMRPAFLAGMTLLLTQIFAFAQCEEKVDFLVVGDSQTGAAWTKSGIGNFLPGCLKGNFIMYGRGGTVPANWLGAGGLDNIDTVQRDPSHEQVNLGNGKNVPDCKKRIEPMLAAHQPTKLLLQFGGNLIGRTDADITQQIENLMAAVTVQAIAPERCYFLTPTYEMAVATHRSVPQRSLANVLNILHLIEISVKGRCQIIDGVNLMTTSPYFDGKELLKRVLISGRSGCGGASVNDNVHVCGEAAKDMAERICAIVNN